MIVHHEVVHVVVLGGLLPSSAPLTASLLEGTPLDATGFTGAEAASRRTNRKVKAASDAAKLTARQRAATPVEARRMLRSQGTGAWPTAMPDALNGTELLKDEFQDSLRLHFELTPSSLPHRCEG